MTIETMIINGYIDQLAKRYVDAYDDCDHLRARDIFLNHPHHFVSNDEMVILYVRISRGTLDRIKSNPEIIADHEFIQSCYLEYGDHIYLLKAFGSSKGFRKLINRLQVLYGPDTISYHRDDLKRLHKVYTRRI